MNEIRKRKKKGKKKTKRDFNEVYAKKRIGRIAKLVSTNVRNERVKR